MVALSHVDDVASIIAASIGNEKAHKQVSITHALLPLSCHVSPHDGAKHRFTPHCMACYYNITPQHITPYNATPLHTSLYTPHYTRLHHIIPHHTTLDYTTPHEVFLRYITSHQVFNCGTDKFVSYNSLCKAIAKAASCKYSTARTHYTHGECEPFVRLKNMQQLVQLLVMYLHCYATLLLLLLLLLLSENIAASWRSLSCDSF
jgi:hypothetical protein